MPRSEPIQGLDLEQQVAIPIQLRGEHAQHLTGVPIAHAASNTLIREKISVGRGAFAQIRSVLTDNEIGKCARHQGHTLRVVQVARVQPAAPCSVQGLDLEQQAAILIQLCGDQA